MILPSRVPARAILALVAVLLSPAIANAGTFRSLDGWNDTENTGSAMWQFGTSTTLGGPLTHFTLHGASTSAPTYDWWSYDGVPQGPVMAFNSTGSTLTIPASFDLIWPADQLMIAPGAKNGTPHHTVLRWVAPESGLYDIDGLFSDLQRASVSINVLVNGSSIFNAGFSGFTMHQGDRPFSLSGVFVAQGSPVDFVVSSGGDDGNDVLGISATIITAVPEPSTFALAGGGVGGLLLVGRRLFRKS